MSEKVLKVLSNCAQGLSEEQKSQARSNIGAQAQLTAGTGISISNNTISCTFSGEQADWTAPDSSPASILHKPYVTEIKERTGSSAYGPVYENVPQMTLSDQIISTNTSGNSTPFGIVAPVPSSSDAGKVLVAGTSSTHWEEKGNGGKLLRHDAELYLHHTVGSTKTWHVRNVINNAINHVAVTDHTSDICDLVIEAPTVDNDEEYSFTVQFDCTNSSGHCDVDVENCVPMLVRRTAIHATGQYLRITASDTSSDAITKEALAVTQVYPNSRNIKDGDGVQQSVVYSVGQHRDYLQITSASYYSVTEQTKLAGPYVVTDVDYNSNNFVHDCGITFSGDPMYQVRVHGNVWELVRF